MNKMLEDLVEVVREVEIKPGCWTDTEIMLRRFIRTHHTAITDMAKRLEAADALLREAVEWNWLDDWVSDMRELDGRIQAHLQESGE